MKAVVKVLMAMHAAQSEHIIAIAITISQCIDNALAMTSKKTSAPQPLGFTMSLDDVASRVL